MEAVVDRDFCLAGGGEEVFDVGDGIAVVKRGLESGRHLAFWMEKVIVWVNEHNSCVRGSGGGGSVHGCKAR